MHLLERRFVFTLNKCRTPFKWKQFPDYFRVIYQHKHPTSQHFNFGAVMMSYSSVALRNRQEVIERIKEKGIVDGHVYLRGASPLPKSKWTDSVHLFEQESNFYYLTGVEEEDYHLIIDISNSKSTILIPNRSETHIFFNGPDMPISALEEKYGMEVMAFDDGKVLLSSSEKDIYIIRGTNTDIFETDTTNRIKESRILEWALYYSRMFKKKEEVELMREAALISKKAHMALMSAAKKAKPVKENDLCALFYYSCQLSGAKSQAYTPIVALNKGAAILHYTQNDAVSERDDELLLVDAGAKFKYYCSDVTRTYPINGKFSEPAKKLYNIVLEMQTKSIEALKPGVEWKHLYKVASMVALNGLVNLGIIKLNEKSIDEVHDMGIMQLVFPHSLGHFIGIDVHDVSSDPEDYILKNDNEETDRPKNKYMYSKTIVLGSVVTVEPGLYFSEYAVQKLKEKFPEYVDVDTLSIYTNAVGGIRIEDYFYIGENGPDNLSESIPKTVEEIEEFMSKS